MIVECNLKVLETQNDIIDCFGPHIYEPDLRPIITKQHLDQIAKENENFYVEHNTLFWKGQLNVEFYTTSK